MVWLLLCIISYIGIFLVFKLIDTKKAPLLNCVIINYLTATILGFTAGGNYTTSDIFSANWIPLGVILGILFIATFLLVGVSSKESGLGITTLASKMSLVIPMLFAIICYNESTSLPKISAIIMAVVAVSLCSYKPSGTNKASNWKKIAIPIVLFLAMGLNDSLVVFAQKHYNITDDSAIFTATLFGISLICGISLACIKKETLRGFLNIKSWIFGILLGSFNFGSVYFVIETMNRNIIATSKIYGICNTTTVLLAIIIGRIFFKEKLTKLNLAGAVLAIISVAILGIE
ncbi:MAG: EamA family transporter [Bacteroidales bacterium]|nr:EamA family transporter [Bacteroidales bacterium]